MSIAMKTIHDPLTGDSIAADDIDGLLAMQIALRQQQDEIRLAQTDIARALLRLTTCDSKTRRVTGKQYTAKLTIPKDNWDQMTLRRLYMTSHETAKRFMKIERFAPKLREIDKLERMDGDEEFNFFRKELLNARKPSEALPRVEIEVNDA